jgi:hypothetical protein
MSLEAELLQAIYEELRQSRLSAIGFGHPPKPRFVYANRQYSDALWYFWNGAKNEHEPIPHHALTGHITQLEIEEKEFRGKPDHKVNLHIKADRAYIIQAGFDTLFAKGLLYTLSKLPVEAFQQLITIAVEAGETEQVLFCRIYNPATGNLVYAPYPNEVNWQAIAQRVVDKINKSRNLSSQTAGKSASPTRLEPAKPTAKTQAKPTAKTHPFESQQLWLSIHSWLLECGSTQAIEQLWVNLKASDKYWSIIQQFQAETIVEQAFQRSAERFRSRIETGKWEEPA